MSNLVLVIDMVNGFMDAGRNLYCGDEARKIIPNIRALLEFEKASGSDIIFIADTHEPDDLEFQMFPVDGPSLGQSHRLEVHGWSVFKGCHIILNSIIIHKTFHPIR